MMSLIMCVIALARGSPYWMDAWLPGDSGYDIGWKASVFLYPSIKNNINGNCLCSLPVEHAFYRERSTGLQV
jgi:hypothetical protein